MCQLGVLLPAIGALGVVMAAEAQAPLASVYVRDGRVEGTGLKPIDTSASDDTFQVTTLEGVECFLVGHDNSWLRLVLDPAWAGGETGPATIGVRFFDNHPADGPGPVVMQYDSSDPDRL